MATVRVVVEFTVEEEHITAVGGTQTFLHHLNQEMHRAQEQSKIGLVLDSVGVDDLVT